MNHVEQSRLWADGLGLPGVSPTGWAAVRAAVAAARSEDLPAALDAINWLVEVECLAHPEAQRVLTGWLEAEAEGRHDPGPPHPGAGRVGPSPEVAEARALAREAAALDRLRDELHHWQAEFRGDDATR